MDTYILAFDIGATNGRAQLQDMNGKALNSATFLTPKNYIKGRDEIVRQAKRLSQGRTIAACGVGVAAPVKQTGELKKSGNLPGWTGRDLASDLSKALGSKRRPVPTRVANDAAVAALAEFAHYGHALVMLTRGTGVGGGAVEVWDSKPYLRAGEFGHTIVDVNSTLQCGCGAYGCLEALIGGSNMEQRFGITGDKLSDDQWHQVQVDFAKGIRSLSTVFMDTPFVIGGGVTRKRGGLDELQRLVDSMPSTADAPTILPAHHGDDAGWVGAGQLARLLVEQA